jgi:hypothetical protein
MVVEINPVNIAIVGRPAYGFSKCGLLQLASFLIGKPFEESKTVEP